MLLKVEQVSKADQQGPSSIAPFACAFDNRAVFVGRESELGVLVARLDRGRAAHR
jgi:hypothetical protein